MSNHQLRGLTDGGVGSGFRCLSSPPFFLGGSMTMRWCIRTKLLPYLGWVQYKLCSRGLREPWFCLVLCLVEPLYATLLPLFGSLSLSLSLCLASLARPGSNASACLLGKHTRDESRRARADRCLGT